MTQVETGQKNRNLVDIRRPRNFRSRILTNRIAKIACIGALLVLLYPFADILYLFVLNGVESISWPRLTENTVGGISLGGGGLNNALEGSLFLIGLSTAIVVPLGVFGGVYLAEFSNNNSISLAARFMADILAGVPSIVLGYVGFSLLVLYFGWGFSAMAAAITLSALMFPYILRTTELSLRRVPESIREGALALGSNKTSMINRLTLRFALPGILTGVLLAVSISVGETAPLIYTASFSNYATTALFHTPVGYLTYMVYVFSQIPTADAHALAYLASFLLVVIVLMINLASRVGIKKLAKPLESEG